MRRSSGFACKVSRLKDYTALTSSRDEFLLAGFKHPGTTVGCFLPGWVDREFVSQNNSTVIQLHRELFH